MNKWLPILDKLLFTLFLLWIIIPSILIFIYPFGLNPKSVNDVAWRILTFIFTPWIMARLMYRVVSDV